MDYLWPVEWGWWVVQVGQGCSGEAGGWVCNQDLQEYEECIHGLEPWGNQRWQYILCSIQNNFIIINVHLVQST